MEAQAQQLQAQQAGRHSAPASPRVQRAAQRHLSLNLDPSKIPRPASLTSPVPLRRSGSLRVRGERREAPSSAYARRGALGGGGPYGGGPAASPCTSILEGAEAWKHSLRGRGADGDEDGCSLPPLMQQRHHRSLQSLTSTPYRSSSVDSYPHTPTPSPEEFEHSRSHNLRFLLDHSKEFSGDRDQEDLDSLRSYGSNCSTQSACDHAHFGRNGTTFSGRRMKYIVHCSSRAEPEEYLTPTQRANQQIRRLKALLEQSRKDLEQKDENIFKLTKEVVELRLLRDEADCGEAKASTSSIEVTPKLVVNGELVRTDKIQNLSENESGTPASLSDSGHFDDLLSTTPAHSQHSPGPRRVLSSNESERLAETYQRRIDDMARRQNEKSIEDRKSLVDMYEKKMEEMSRKLIEKEKTEKKYLIEMYEKKIEGMAQEQKKNVAGCGKNSSDILTKNFENEKQAVIVTYEKRIQDLQMKYEDSYQQCKESVVDEVNALKLLLQEANNRCSDLQQELFQARERLVELEEESEILKTTLQQHKVTESNFKEKDPSVNEEQESETCIQDQFTLECQIADLKSSIKSLKENMEDAEHWKQETSTRNSTIEALMVEVKTLNHQLEIERNSIVQLEHNHRSQITQLQSEHESALAFFQENLNENSKQKIQLENKCKELQKLVDDSIKMQEKNEKLRNFLREGKSLLEKSNAEVATSKNQIDGLIQSLAEKDRELNISCQALCNLEEEMSVMKSVLSEYKLQNKSLISANEVLERERAELEVLGLEMESIKGVLAEKEKQSKEFNLKVQKVNDRAAEEQVKLLQGLQTEVESLKDDRNVKEKQLQDSKINLEKAEAKVAYLENEVCSIQQSLIQKDQELKLYFEKSNQLQDKIHILQKVISEYEERSKELTELREKQGFFLGLQTETESLNKLITEGNEQLEESVNNIISLKSQIDSLNMQVNEKDQALAENILKCHQYEKETNTLKEKVALLEKEYTQLSGIKDELEKNLSLTEGQLRNIKVSPHQSSEVLHTSMNNLQHVYQDLLLERHKTTSLEKEIESLKQVMYSHHSNEIQHIKDSNSEGPNASIQDSINEADTNHSDELAWLQAEVESLRKALAEQEKRHNEINLKMYLKGQEAAKFERKDEVLEMAAHSPDKVSVPELLSQLAETEKELEKVKVMYRRLAEGQASNSSSPEATLLFLKSAFYYFLTDEANCQGHLHAIQSILGFTESEKQAVDTLTYFRR